MNIREIIKSNMYLNIVEKIIGKENHDEIVKECAKSPVMQGNFANIHQLGVPHMFTYGNKALYFTIETLIPEDGSGTKFLINYESKTAEYHGYVDLKTMHGWLQKTN